jgi:hypothetical protein
MLTDKERNEVATIQATMQQRLAALRADTTIVPRERQRRMAKAVLGARERIAQINTQASTRQEKQQARAYRTLFELRTGHSAEDRAYRDNLAARVAEGSLDATGASKLYNIAAARGDDMAMTALAELAWANSGNELGGSAWHPILDAYRGRSDELESAMTTLVSIVSPDKLGVMRERLEMEVTQPSDLPGNLDFLASDADSTSSDPQPAQNWQAG